MQAWSRLSCVASAGLVRLLPGSTLTFGAHDQAILTRSLVADIALPALLLAPHPRLLPPVSGPARSLAPRACGARQAGEPGQRGEAVVGAGPVRADGADARAARD
jgi:hypothetical protein